MPTLPGAEDGVRAARKFLSERLLNPNQLSKKENNVSLVSSTINQLGKQICGWKSNRYVLKRKSFWINDKVNFNCILGQEARNTRNTISNAFSSIFGMKKSRGDSSSNTSSPLNNPSTDATSSPVNNASRVSSNTKFLDSPASNPESLMMGK